jgi:hypothetical protein
MLPATLIKFLSFGSLGLGVALAAASTFGWVQTTRLGAARETIAARDTTIASLNDRVRNDAILIVERDRLIGVQNAAVQAIVTAQANERTAYLARIDQAQKVAGTYKAQAATIMQRNVETTDELERARAALSLIEEVVGKE